MKCTLVVKKRISEHLQVPDGEKLNNVDINVFHYSSNFLKLNLKTYQNRFNDNSNKSDLMIIQTNLSYNKQIIIMQLIMFTHPNRKWLCLSH